MSQLKGTPWSSRLEARHRFAKPVPEKCLRLDQKPSKNLISGLEGELLRILGSAVHENHWKNRHNQQNLQPVWYFRHTYIYQFTKYAGGHVMCQG